METNRIPLTVGVTGHRILRPEDEPALAAGVKRELERLRAAYPHTPLVMLNSLAEGADQLCAEVALGMDVPLIAALPMAQAAYEKDFAGPALDRFRSLLGRAEQSFVAPAAEAAPKTPDRDFSYRQAGIYVATHCHVLLALWDGEAGTEAGCGTAEAVDFALHRSYHPLLSAPLFSAAARCDARRARAASSSSGLRADSAPSSAKPGSGELWNVPSGTPGGAGMPVKIWRKSAFPRSEWERPV